MSTCDVAAIGWILALIGIFVNNRFANHRETRKEMRSKIDFLNKSLDNLLDASRNYYLDANSSSPKESFRIHEAINTCDRIVEELLKSNQKINLRSDFYDLYEKVTGGKFESANHVPGKHHSDLCKDISIKKEDLMKTAEAWFSKAFNQNTSLN